MLMHPDLTINIPLVAFKIYQKDFPFRINPAINERLNLPTDSKNKIEQKSQKTPIINKQKMSDPKLEKLNE